MFEHAIMRPPFCLPVQLQDIASAIHKSDARSLKEANKTLISVSYTKYHRDLPNYSRPFIVVFVISHSDLLCTLYRQSVITRPSIDATDLLIQAGISK